MALAYVRAIDQSLYNELVSGICRDHGNVIRTIPAVTCQVTDSGKVKDGSNSCLALLHCLTYSLLCCLQQPLHQLFSKTEDTAEAVQVHSIL